MARSRVKSKAIRRHRPNREEQGVIALLIVAIGIVWFVRVLGIIG